MGTTRLRDQEAGDLCWVTVMRKNAQAAMRALVVIAASTLLLAACQSKRDTCALWRGDQIDNAEAIKRLGLKPDTYWTFVESYCEFYKS